MKWIGEDRESEKKLLKLTQKTEQNTEDESENNESNIELMPTLIEQHTNEKEND